MRSPPVCCDTWAVDAVEKILNWADEHAEELTKGLVWQLGTGSRGYWLVVDPQAEGKIRARVAAALDFLERFAGPDSRWAASAREAVNRHGYVGNGARAVSNLLEEWIRMVRVGQVSPRLTEAFSVRAVSSTDLLEQVRALNADNAVAPAAPIVLAGAALEIALRSAIDELGVEVTDRPGIDAYAKALRRADVLNKQDAKDITQMAGLRNEAAHGQHELLSRERAGLMEQQVNLFLERLEQAVHQVR